MYQGSMNEVCNQLVLSVAEVSLSHQDPVPPLSSMNVLQLGVPLGPLGCSYLQILFHLQKLIIIEGGVCLSKCMCCVIVTHVHVRTALHEL